MWRESTKNRVTDISSAPYQNISIFTIYIDNVNIQIMGSLIIYYSTHLNGDRRIIIIKIFFE